MTAYSKRLPAFLGGAMFLALCVLFFLCSPLTSNAQVNTLGVESPFLYCKYSQNGEEVDGNNLTAGTYDVTFAVKGMENISVAQLTASYDSASVTVDQTPRSLMTDSFADMQSMGYVISEDQMVFGFVSINEDTTAVSSSETALATVSVTFANDCDAESVISFESSPKLTFFEADYGDGYDDSYALDIYAAHKGSLYPMTADVTPKNTGYSVSGSIVVAIDNTGKDNNKAAYGEYTFTVYSDAERTEEFGTFTSTYDDEEKTNTFSLNLPNGTYYATLTSEYSLAREDITITVDGADINDVEIPVIACDFKVDDAITSADTRVVMTAASSDDSAQYAYCDLNADGSITSADTRIVMACAVDLPDIEEMIID